MGRRIAQQAKLLLLGHSCDDCHFCPEWPGNEAMGIQIDKECKLRSRGSIPKKNICSLWEKRGDERFIPGQSF